jgi:serine/threonine protein kinase
LKFWLAARTKAYFTYISYISPLSARINSHANSYPALGKRRNHAQEARKRSHRIEKNWWLLLHGVAVDLCIHDIKLDKKQHCPSHCTRSTLKVGDNTISKTKDLTATIDNHRRIAERQALLTINRNYPKLSSRETFHKIKSEHLDDTGAKHTYNPIMNVSWLQQLQQQQRNDNDHASLRYDDVAAAGAPARPLDFPAPTVHRATFCDIAARDHRSGSIHQLKRVLIRAQSPSNHNGITSSGNFHTNHKVATSNASLPDTAYLPTKKLARTVYGSMKLCIVLKRIDRSKQVAERKAEAINVREDRQDDDDDLTAESSTTDTVEWESTDYLVAVKFSEWKRIHHLRGKHLEDPIKECAALQLLGNYHPHVLGAVEVLQDDTCLYTVMPYLGGGDLYGRLLEHVGYRSHGAVGGKGKSGFDENIARTWFRQLLLVRDGVEYITLSEGVSIRPWRLTQMFVFFFKQAVQHLQQKGVCHRDISLENLLLDKDDKVCLIDPGMSLRVPYTDQYGGGVTDVSAGTSRRLMISQGQGGKLMYAAPEIIANHPEVDPFATDLWAVGVVLFVMLVGLAPFKWAHPSDKRFNSISKGGLKSLVEALEIPLSPEAIDLLQGFFYADPRKRWTLSDVMQHPWVLGKEFVHRPQTFPHASSKRFNFYAQDLKGKRKSPSKPYGRGNKISPAEVHRNMHLLSPHS